MVTGPPGSGKTTLAIQVLRALLENLPDAAPVPVLVSLAGWDPAVTPRLTDWLEDRLIRDYPVLRDFGKDAALALSERGQILPILDGLDEVPENARPGILAAINKAATALPGYIVTCRYSEFARLVSDATALASAAVISAKPLDTHSASDYLRRQLPPARRNDWTDFLYDLRSGSLPRHVEDVCRSPLGLWLISEIYAAGARDPAELISSAYSTSNSLRARLMSELVPAVVGNRPPARRRSRRRAEQLSRPRRTRSAHDVEEGLSVLAADLRSQHARDWIWWAFPATLFNKRYTRLAFRTLIFTVVSAWMTTVQLGMAVLIAGRVPTVEDTLDVLPLIAIFSTPTLFIKVFSRIAAPIDLRIRGRGRALAYTATVSFLVTAILLASQLGTYGGAGQVIRASGALLRTGAVIFVALTFFLFASMHESRTSARSPYGGYRAALIELVLYITFSEIVAAGVLFASGGGPPALIAVEFNTIVLPYVVLRSPVAILWLAVIAGKMSRRHRHLPFRMAVFLDDVHRLGLLRTVGSAYQFRHAELQDYFAPVHDAAPKQLLNRRCSDEAKLGRPAFPPTKRKIWQSAWVAIGALVAVLASVLTMLGLNGFLTPVFQQFDRNYLNLVKHLPSEVKSCQRAKDHSSYWDVSGRSVDSLADADCAIGEDDFVTFASWRSPDEARKSVLPLSGALQGNCGSLPSKRPQHQLWAIDGESGVISCSTDQYGAVIRWSRNDSSISVEVFDAPAGLDVPYSAEQYDKLLRGSFTMVEHLR